MKVLAILAALSLAACGVAGEPVAPTKAAAPGLTVSGEVSTGVVFAP